MELGLSGGSGSFNPSTTGALYGDRPEVPRGFLGTDAVELVAVAEGEVAPREDRRRARAVLQLVLRDELRLAGRLEDDDLALRGIEEEVFARQREARVRLRLGPRLPEQLARADERLRRALLPRVEREELAFARDREEDPVVEERRPEDLDGDLPVPHRLVLELGAQPDRPHVLLAEVHQPV